MLYEVITGRGASALPGHDRGRPGPQRGRGRAGPGHRGAHERAAGHGTGGARGALSRPGQGEDPRHP